MIDKTLSHTELVIEPVKPTLRYAVAITKEQIQAIQDNGCLKLNLYVTNEFWIEVSVFGDHENDIDDDKVIKSKPQIPMQGSWFP